MAPTIHKALGIGKTSFRITGNGRLAKEVDPEKAAVSMATCRTTIFLMALKLVLEEGFRQIF